MPGTPENRDREQRLLDARAKAARNLLTAAALTVNEDDPLCWRVRDGDQASAPWYLFWPATGHFRREDGPGGYSVSALIGAIRKARAAG